jgi:hypothetical protein
VQISQLDPTPLLFKLNPLAQAAQLFWPSQFMQLGMLQLKQDLKSVDSVKLAGHDAQRLLAWQFMQLDMLHMTQLPTVLACRF